MSVSFIELDVRVITKDTGRSGIQGSRVQLRARRMGMFIITGAREISLMNVMDCFTRGTLRMREVSP